MKMARRRQNKTRTVYRTARGYVRRNRRSKGAFGLKEVALTGLGTIVSYLALSKVAPSFAAYSVPAGLVAAGALAKSKTTMEAGVGTAVGLFALPYISGALGIGATTQHADQLGYTVLS